MFAIEMRVADNQGLEPCARGESAQLHYAEPYLQCAYLYVATVEQRVFQPQRREGIGCLGPVHFGVDH